MSFLAPLFLIGLVAASLPVLIHLINRRKATRRAFPALALLVESNKRTARAIKVRQRALLALRVGVIALIALSLAKPFCLDGDERGEVATGERLPTAVAIVIDTSASMRHGSWWEDAKEQALDSIDDLRPWDEVALLPTHDPSSWPARMSSDHAVSRDRAEELAASWQATDMGRALGAASDLLSTSQLPQRRIVVISDFTRDALDAARAPEAPISYPVESISVRDQADRVTNLSVTDVSYRQDGANQDTWHIEARVRLEGSEAAEDIEVRLMIDDTLLSTGVIERIEPGEEATHVFRHRHEGEGALVARVELDEGVDEYPVDNVWYFVFRARSRVRVLIVNGEASSDPYEDEAFFLTRALNPSREVDSGIVPNVISPDGLSREALDGADAVVLANVSRLAGGGAAELERYVRGGGGVLLTMGDRIEPEALNTSMAALLPRSLRGVKQLAERDDPDAPVKITRLGATDHSHPIFRAFALPGGNTLQSAQVYAYMLLEPAATESGRTLLSFKDNAPALVERRVGNGRVMLWTTTIDYEWTDLPIRAPYLPLMQRAVQYLARRATSASQSRAVAGDAVKMEVGGMIAQRAIVRGPLGHEGVESVRIVLEPDEDSITWEADAPGVYKVWGRGRQRSGERAVGSSDRCQRGAAGILPRSDEGGGSWRRGWSRARRAARRARGGGLTQRATIATRRVNLWPKILFIVTLLLLAETVLGTRRSVLLKIGRALGIGRAAKES